MGHALFHPIITTPLTAVPSALSVSMLSLAFGILGRESSFATQDPIAVFM